MMTIEVNPLWLEMVGPALLGGLILGALITWLVLRRRQKRLELEKEELETRILGQEALQSERDAAFQAASGELARSFAELANRSLQANSDNFLRLAEQKMQVQNEKAKRALGEREQAVENLVKPIRDALRLAQITAPYAGRQTKSSVIRFSDCLILIVKCIDDKDRTEYFAGIDR